MPIHGFLPTGGLPPHACALALAPAPAASGRKRKKDPNAPKRASSAYNIFVAQNSEAARNRQSSNKEAVKTLGESWKVRGAALRKYGSDRRLPSARLQVTCIVGVPVCRAYLRAVSLRRS